MRRALAYCTVLHLRARDARRRLKHSHLEATINLLVPQIRPLNHRYSAFFQVYQPRILGSRKSLFGPGASPFTSTVVLSEARFLLRLRVSLCGFWAYILCASKFSSLLLSATQATLPGAAASKVVPSLKKIMQCL